MHSSPWGQREVRKKHDSPLSPLPAVGSISVAPFPSSQSVPSCLSLNAFWAPRCRLETRFPGVQVTPQFKHCQSAHFHLLLSSPNAPRHLSVCLPICLSVSLTLRFQLSARRWGLSDGGFFCLSLSLSALMSISVTTVCVFTKRKTTIQKYMGEKTRSEWERGRKKEKESMCDWVWCMRMRVC